MAGEAVVPEGEVKSSEAAIAAMQEQLNATASGQQEMHDWLRSEPWKDAVAQAAGGPAPAGEEKGGAADGGYDFSFLDDDDTGFGAEQFDPGKLAAGLAPVITKAIGDATAPLQQRLDQQQHDAAVSALLTEFPELQDDKVAKQVVDTAKEIAASMGTPDIGMNPGFWRQTYLAGRALDQARQEGTAPPAVAHLEGAGGAGPGGGGQADPWDSIKNVKQGSAVLPFS